MRTRVQKKIMRKRVKGKKRVKRKKRIKRKESEENKRKKSEFLC